jgi:hypothetical protein
VQLCFVTEVELHQAAQMRGAIEINMLAGHANIASFGMRHHALYVDTDAFGNLYIQIDVLIGLCTPGGRTAEERPFEGNVDYRTFLLTIVGTQDDHGRERHACKAALFFFRISVQDAWLPLVVTSERLFDASCQFSVVLAAFKSP